jgi:hypothetical protein
MKAFFVQVRRGRTVKENGKLARDIQDLITRENLSDYTIIDGANPAAVIGALTGRDPVNTGTLIVERVSVEGLDFYGTLATFTGVPFQRIEVPTAPVKATETPALNAVEAATPAAANG